MAADGPKKSQKFEYLDIPDDMQVPDPAELALWPRNETFKEKFYRKMSENPLVPIGKRLATAQ